MGRSVTVSDAEIIAAVASGANTIVAIADVVGLARSSIYYRLNTNDTLLAECVKHGFRARRIASKADGVVSTVRAEIAKLEEQIRSLSSRVAVLRHAESVLTGGAHD